MSDTKIPITKGQLIEQVRLHDHHDPHRHESRLAEVILGADRFPHPPLYSFSGP